MRIVFMGSPDFAVPSLDRLYKSDHQIVSVVSNKDKRRGRRAKPTPTAVKKKALELNLPVVEAEDLNDEGFYQKLEALQADLFVVVAFRILPANILELPTKGAINLHASLLPKYRGAAPIHWAVMNGEDKTGCTVFLLDKQVDTGKIIAQQETPIGPNETTGDVYERLKISGSELLVKSVEQISRNEIQPVVQDHQKRTPAPKLYTQDCKIDFNQPAGKVHNKIRGLSPFPTAWATLDELKFNMYRSVMGDKTDLKAGQLDMYGDDLVVGCKQGSVVLKEVQLEGKRRMSGKDFMNGYSGPGILQ